MAEGQPELTKVTIGTSNVTDYLNSWKREDTFGNDNIRNMSIVFSKDIASIISLESSSLLTQLVTVTRGVADAEETTIFKGYIKDWTVLGGNISLNCLDKIYLTKKITLTYSYDKDIDASAGVGSEIFKDMINSYTSLTADATSIQDTGDVLIDKLVIKAEPIYEKLKWLADYYNWTFFYNPETDKVNFEPKGYIDNSTVLQTGININNVPKWKTDETYIYNEVRVNGAEQIVSTTETGQVGVTSGYTTSSIQLNYEPIAVRILVDASNPPTTEKVIGVPGASLTYDYYVDKTKKQLINSSAFTPGASDYVIAQYTYSRPVPVVVSDPDSIEIYNNGDDSSGNPIPKKLTLIRNELKDVSDAESFANEYLTQHKDPIESTVLRVTNIEDLDVGQQVRVVDNNNSKDDFYKISRVKMSYPYSFDEIEVQTVIKDETDFMVMLYRRQQQLALEQKQDFDFLISTLALNNNVIYENTYLKIENTSVTGETLIFDSNVFGILDTNKFYDVSERGFILGHPTYGVLGTSALGAGSFETEDIVISQAHNRYVELFLDDVFKGATTTADWDTTNKWVELTNTEIAVSDYIALDTNAIDSYYTTVTFTITGTELDELTYYIGEFDNSTVTYSEVTTTGSSASRTGTLALSGTNNYGINWKAENTGGTTAKITKLIINYN